MASQQICLKWNSFQSNIVTSFENLWEEEGLVDVTLASEGQCIRAHKIILSACSPFFRRIFEANPCQHPVIILQDVHYPELEALLCFIYKGEVNIEQDDLPALLKAAESLQIRGLCGASYQGKQSRSSSFTSDTNAPPAKRQRSSSSSLPPPPLLAPPPLHRAKNKHRAESNVNEERSTSPPAATLAKTEPNPDPICEDSESLASLPLEESMDEGAPEDLQAMIQQPSRSSGPRHGEKLSLADINQLKGSAEDDAQEELEQKVFARCFNTAGDENGPAFERLPYACLLPRREVLTTWAQARTLEQLGCDLMKLLFSTEERLLCNVNGKMGKRQFNIHKVQLIKEVLNHYSGMSPSDFEEQWKSCVTKIDTANRGLKRNLVLKGRKTTFLL